MKELIIKILKMFAGKAVNNIENGTSATTQEAIKSAANDKIKDLAGSAVKSAIGGATQAAMSGASTAALGSMVSSYILPVIAGVIGLSALTVGGIALKNYITKDLTIDQTANVVEKIRTISVLSSVQLNASVSMESLFLNTDLQLLIPWYRRPARELLNIWQ